MFRIATARRSSSIGHPPSVPIHRAHLRRRRLPGPKTAAAIAKAGTWKLDIVKRNELHRFIVLPKRWIVERTLAWISHNRRLARDFERYARRSLHTSRHDPHHAPTLDQASSLFVNPNFLDRLLLKRPNRAIRLDCAAGAAPYNFRARRRMAAGTYYSNRLLPAIYRNGVPL
jgi:hypothetical protein